MNISLKQFLQTGTLGELHVGMTGDEVLRLLGESDFPDKSDQKEGAHWSYGDFSVGLLRWKQPFLWVYGLQWYPTPESVENRPSPFVIDDWGITGEMKPEDVKAYLNSNGFKFKYRNTKGYIKRVNNNNACKLLGSSIPPELQELMDNSGPLVFKKPKNEAEILRITIFTSIYLESGVIIAFIDDKLIHIFKHDFEADVQ